MFLGDVKRWFMDKGWKNIDGYPEKFDLILSCKETRNVVTIKRVDCFY